MPSMDTVANNDVEGKRNGLICPFNATRILRMDNAAFKILKNTTSYILLGLRATKA